MYIHFKGDTGLRSKYQKKKILRYREGAEVEKKKKKQERWWRWGLCENRSEEHTSELQSLV